MYCRMLSCDSHAVSVQNVHFLSGSSATFKQPGAFCTCICDRTAYNAKPGKNRIDRSRKRVKLTKTIDPPLTD